MRTNESLLKSQHSDIISVNILIYIFCCCNWKYTEGTILYPPLSHSFGMNIFPMLLFFFFENVLFYGGIFQFVQLWIGFFKQLEAKHIGCTAQELLILQFISEIVFGHLLQWWHHAKNWLSLCDVYSIGEKTDMN